MQKFLNCLVIAAVAIAASWAWRGQAVPMPPAPLSDTEKLYCLSYAPFRDGQSPFIPGLRIPATQIEEDLAALAKVTDCVRIYAVDMGLEHVPAIAARHGLKVLLGIWISGTPRDNRTQIKAGVALANQYRDTVRAVIVGNEVLLRRDLPVEALEDLIRDVRAQVPVPVTYADVWEFWLQNRALARAVDFVTVHILPYWEDMPVRAEDAADHITRVRAQVADVFADKEIIIGEAGWPSAGRMREAALPSPVNQARVIHELAAAAQAGRFRVNLIEAFDQPWKRRLEGTVGGAWGVLPDNRQSPKVAWGHAVSNAPWWPWAALGGLLLGAAIFGTAESTRRRAKREAFDARGLLRLTVLASVAGALAGTAVQALCLEAHGIGGWVRSMALTALALIAPLAAAGALGAGQPLPALVAVLGPRRHRTHAPLARLLGWIIIGVALLAGESALGLCFNPRYLDFPWATLTMASVSLALLPGGSAPAGALMTERLFALLALACAARIVVNETLANWQAVWLAASLVLLGFTLSRVLPAQSPATAE